MSCEVEILAKLNAMLIVKHGELFNIDGKAPSWIWVIKKLDSILMEYKKFKKGYKNGTKTTR